MTTTETSQRLRICLERDSLLLIKEEILRYRSKGFFATAQKDVSLSIRKRFFATAQKDASLSIRKRFFTTAQKDVSLSLRGILRYRSERRFAIDQKCAIH
ncbi:MAG: hypothetical protein K8H85_18485 [Cyclobacteriaceae bacterium]|nr:hypothetical protein [Cyclobacteriaceae bacterium]